MLQEVSEWREYLAGLYGQSEREERGGGRRGQWAWICEVSPHLERERERQREERERFTLSLPQLFNSTRALFLPGHLRAMTVMIIVWFMYSFG